MWVKVQNGRNHATERHPPFIHVQYKTNSRETNVSDHSALINIPVYNISLQALSYSFI